MRERNTNRGITLIALVITIIVLLILAAVSIATLTGENGILTKARTAKEETDEATAEEKVKIAVMASYDENGNLNLGLLEENLIKEGITGFDKEKGFPQIVKVDDYEVTIGEKGEVTVGDKTPSTPIQKSELEEAKEKGTVLNENSPTSIKDKYDNAVVVPEGFKIASDSADDVTGGIVIEDVSHGATAGSQFVWIPVGTIYTNVEKTQSKTITLGRYNFDSNGNPTAYSGDCKEEDATDTANLLKYGNTIARNIEAFKTSVNNNGGYYIGRYESRTKTQRTAGTNDDGLGQATVKGNEYIYNYVTQPQAAKLSQEMYMGKNFTSDLINSYAWDTAIIFVQTFGNSSYSKQIHLYSSSASTGTNNLADKNNQDIECNIWDMSSNDCEWTTETFISARYSYTLRGGSYSTAGLNYTTESRYPTDYFATEGNSFRPIIYL